ncbi:endonuclease V isoform X1 [Pan paniscus]
MALEAAGGPPEETLSLWKREQARLKAHVVDRDTEAWQRDPAFSGLQRVGGVDVSFVKGDSVRACASLVVLTFPELEVVYEESRMVSLTAPYVSGFLAFREVPFLLELVQQLREKEPGLMPQAGPSCGWKRGTPPPRLWGGLPPWRPYRPAVCWGGQETSAGGWAGEQRPAQGEGEEGPAAGHARQLSGGAVVALGTRTLLDQPLPADAALLIPGLWPGVRKTCFSPGAALPVSAEGALSSSPASWVCLPLWSPLPLSHRGTPSRAKSSSYWGQDGLPGCPRRTWCFPHPALPQPLSPPLHAQVPQPPGPPPPKTCLELPPTLFLPHLPLHLPPLGPHVGTESETLAMEGAVDTPSCFTGWQILRAETASLIPPSSQIRLLQTRGDSFPLLGDSGTVLGMALRSHDRSTRPLYISVGHRMSLEAAVRLTCCCCRFRIPEPVRQADISSREHIRKSLGLPGPPTLRSPKAQRPVACPKRDSGESSGEGQPPQDHSPGPRTAPRPGSQEQTGKDWQ